MLNIEINYELLIMLQDSLLYRNTVKHQISRDVKRKNDWRGWGVVKIIEN